MLEESIWNIHSIRTRWLEKYEIMSHYKVSAVITNTTEGGWVALVPYEGVEFEVLCIWSSPVTQLGGRESSKVEIVNWITSLYTAISTSIVSRG